VDPVSGPSEGSRLVLVAGSGRSGTSTVSGALKYLGLHVPQPEIPASKSNPRGFFEPEWVIAFHRRHLSRAGVVLRDARPDAASRVEEVTLRPRPRAELSEWLSEQFAAAPELLVKDPRITWFLPLWSQTATALGVRPGFLTMLRHPAEVVGSKSTYYAHPGKHDADAKYTGATFTANWIAMMLVTERHTRDTDRAYVQYADLLTDWRATLGRAAETLRLSMRAGMDPAGVAEVDAFIDPSLHRVKVTWDDVDAPAPLKDLAEQVWQEVLRIVEADGHRPASSAALDQMAEAYADLYRAAEATTISTVDAAVRDARQRPQQGPGKGSGRGSAKGSATGSAKGSAMDGQQKGQRAGTPREAGSAPASAMARAAHLARRAGAKGRRVVAGWLSRVRRG